MAVTKSEGDGNHPSSHYLVVEDVSKPTTWHLRVRNVSGKLDHTLMGAAWAALHGGYRGNTYAGPNKQEALSKLTKLYKQEGMTPPSGSKSMIYKDKSGQLWYVGVYSNNFEDREGEILSWKSHLEYSKWVRNTNVKLPITVAHYPKYPPEVHAAQFIGLATGKITAEEFSDNYLKMYAPYAIAQSELVVPVNGFTLVIGKILEGKESKVELIKNLGWGMSHGFFTLEREDNVIQQYRSFEFSVLPTELAANMVTMSSSVKGNTMEETLKGLSDEDRNALSELLNADPTSIEEATAKAQAVLLNLVESKELGQDEGESEPENEQAESKNYEEIRDKIFSELGVEQLNKAFEQLATALQRVEEKMDTFDARLQEKERSEDERIAEQLISPGMFFWNKELEESAEPENAEELKDKALGDRPVDGIDAAMNSNNPMQFAWNGLLNLGSAQ